MTSSIVKTRNSGAPCTATYWCLSLTFSDVSLIDGLSHGEDGLDEDAHGALGRVDAAHNTEAQTLATRTLLELHRHDLHGERLGTARDEADAADADAALNADLLLRQAAAVPAYKEGKV